MPLKRICWNVTIKCAQEGFRPMPFSLIKNEYHFGKPEHEPPATLCPPQTAVFSAVSDDGHSGGILGTVEYVIAPGQAFLTFSWRMLAIGPNKVHVLLTDPAGRFRVEYQPVPEDTADEVTVDVTIVQLRPGFEISQTNTGTNGITPRSLFNIVLKIFGLYLLLTLLVILPSVVIALTDIFSSHNKGMTLYMYLGPLSLFLAYGGGVYLLIFQSEFLIRLFRLEKGFREDTIPLNVHRSTVLSIAVILIGGLVLIDEIPQLVKLIAQYIQAKQYGGDASKTGLIVSSVKILIGLGLISAQRTIVNFIERRRKA